MVHSAFQAVPVVDRLPLKIESIAGWGRDRLLVGTAEGVVFVYQVRPIPPAAGAAAAAGSASAAAAEGSAVSASRAAAAGKSPFQINLVDAKKQFARRGVTQLEVSATQPLSVLLSLADQTVSVHALPSFSPIGQLKATKGCTLFALNTQVLREMGDSPPESAFREPILACVVKKKLMLFCWDPVATNFVEHKELPLPEVPLAVQWCGDSGNIVLGFKREYSLLNYQDGSTTELFPTGSSGKGRSAGAPIAALLPHDQVLLGRDMISIFLGFDGKPTRKYGVSWSDHPLHVSHVHPFLIALTSKALEVRSMTRSSGNSTSLVQSVALKGANRLSVSLASDTPDAGVRAPEGIDAVQVIYVAAQSAVWRLQPLPMTLQIDQLVREREFEDALELCDCLPRADEGAAADAGSDAAIPNPEERETKRSFVKTLYAHSLFAEYQYSQAMEVFFTLRVHPLHVLSLFPGMLGTAAAARLEKEEAAQLERLRTVFTPAEAAEARIPGLPLKAPFILPPAHTAARIRGSSGTASVSVTNKPEALRALTEYLLQARSLLRRGNTEKGAEASREACLSEDFADVTDDLVIVDSSLATAFLRLQMGSTGANTGSNDADSLRALLSSGSNVCHVAECERMLTHSGRVWEVVLLFRARGMHQRALQLLKAHGEESASVIGAPSPGSPALRGPEQTVLYLRDLEVSHSATGAAALAEVESGEDDAVVSEKNKENTELVFEFSQWVLGAYPEAALRIFTDREQGNLLPPKRVLQHIKDFAPGQVIPLLEHSLAGESQVADGELHDEMVFQYLEQVLALKRDAVYKQKLGDMEADWKSKWAQLNGGSDADAPPLIAGSEPLLLGQTRRKLIAFLETSRHYVPERMLSRFPPDDLFKERAILLSRIGQHDQALHIYAHRLKDPQQAEVYCSEHYDAELEGNRDVYLYLLRVFLQPEHTETQLLRASVDLISNRESQPASQQKLKPMLQPALELLNKYCDKLDVAKALELLPPETPIASLVKVFQMTIRRNNAARRHDQVVKNLLQSENLQVREDLIQARAAAVTIGEDRMCPVCRKRVGTSVFAAYPSGTVVHYICCRDKRVDPVTGERFSEDDPAEAQAKV